MRTIISKFNYGLVRVTRYLDSQEGAVTYFDIINMFTGKLLRRTTFRNGKIINNMPDDDELK